MRKNEWISFILKYKVCLHLKEYDLFFRKLGIFEMTRNNPNEREKVIVNQTGTRFAAKQL